MTHRILPPALAVLLSATTVLAFPSTPQPHRLLPVVGLWSERDDTGPSLVTDGARWSGTTSPAEVDAAARQLFGQATAAFVANGTAAGAFPLAVDRQTASFTDGTLSVRFKLISGPTDQSAGIVIGLQPTGEYRFVRYNTKDGNLALWGYARGERQVIAKGDGLAQLPSGAWHELVVRVQGREVVASVTGHAALHARFTLDAPLTGRVGLWAKRDVVTAFQAFAVEPARQH